MPSKNPLNAKKSLVWCIVTDWLSELYHCWTYFYCSNPAETNSSVLYSHSNYQLNNILLLNDTIHWWLMPAKFIKYCLCIKCGENETKVVMTWMVAGENMQPQHTETEPDLSEDRKFQSAGITKECQITIIVSFVSKESRVELQHDMGLLQSSQ